jgi:hypothetical protein
MRQTTLAGCQRQHDDKDILSNWRSPPRPRAKSLEQVRPITGDTGKWKDGERVADGSVVCAEQRTVQEG